MKKSILLISLAFLYFIDSDAQTYQYIIYPTKDALIKKQDGTNYETTNYGSSTSFTASYEDVSGQYLTSRSLMDFDLSSIPANSNIANAYLHLDGINHSTSTNDSKVTILTGSWDETTVTWQNAPSTGTEYSDISQSTSSAEDYVIDVTSIIDEMLDNPTTTHGILFQLMNETTLGRMEFASSDNTSQGIKAPKLVVNLVTPPLVVSLDEVSSKLFTTTNDGEIKVDVSGGAVPYSYSWTPGSYTTEDISNLSDGTYTLTVTDLVDNEKTLVVKIIDDAAYNWKLSRTYDIDGNVISESKQYKDELDRPTQTLNKDYESGLILANQTLYDAHGRPAIQTLAAPVGNQLVYKDGFIQNTSGHDYSYTDFDVEAKINSPNAVRSNKVSTLGYYYSDNGIEDYVPTTSYPYYRTVYTNDATGRISHSTSAGDEFRMGRNRENRVLYFTIFNELIPIFGTNKSYKVKQDANDRMEYVPLDLGNTLPLKKTININEDGLKIITYKNTEGKIVARALSGDASSGSETYKVTSQLSFLSNGGTVDLHIPEDIDDSLRLLLPEYISSYTNEVPNYSDATNSDIDYEIFDLIENKSLTLNTDYTLNTSTRYVSFIGDYASNDKFIRIKATMTSGFMENVSNNGGVLPLFNEFTYILNYKNWTLNYYDLAGQLRMSVSPEGYVQGGNHSMYTTYDYDPNGNMIASDDPDYGYTEFVYNRENMLRFSQNELQAMNDYYSYINYDTIGRVIETGEYRSVTGSMYFQNYYEDYSIASGDTSALFSLNIVDHLNNSNCHEASFNKFYKLDNDEEINSSTSAYSYKSNYSSYNRPGDLVKTWNDESENWYGYNKKGQLIYYVQHVIESDFLNKTGGIDEEIKTLDFTYGEDNGLLTKKEYQKYEADEMLTYNYTYNENLNLESVVVEDNNNDNLASASFEYYLTGQLKRTVLGGGLQGLDYVYTINGHLKGINHPSIAPEKDPGRDGFDSGSNMLVDKDLFGLVIDYHPDDYSRTNSDVESSVSSGNGYYSGLKKAKRWRIRDKNQINSTTNLYTESSVVKELMYEYDYDDLGRLGKAIFGVYDNSTNSFSSREDYALWGETSSGAKKQIEYDLNGNINKLQRNGYDLGSNNFSMDDLDYNYHSTMKNQLSSIEDNVTSVYSDDFETTGTDNFTYDVIGQMISSDAENISLVKYTSTGKVSEVQYANSDKVYYEYDALGNKIKSKFYDNSTSKYMYKWFIRDQSGAVLSVYTCDENVGGGAELDQQPMRMGSSFATNYNGEVYYSISDELNNQRVAFSEKPNTLKYLSDFSSSVDGWTQMDGSTISYTSGQLKVEDAQAGSGSYKSVSLTQNVEYEFSFSLDMGTASEITIEASSCTSCTTSYSTPLTVTASGDYKITFTPTQTGSCYLKIYEDDNVDDFEFMIGNVRLEESDRLTIENWYDYYPFGEVMPGRNGIGTNTSVLGFMGEEKSENGRWVDFKLRMYNPSLGRWISPDPYHQDASPYAAMGNNPISNIDPDGGWYYDPNAEGWRKRQRYLRIQQAKERLYSNGGDLFHEHNNYFQSWKYEQDLEIVTGMKAVWVVNWGNKSGHYYEDGFRGSQGFGDYNSLNGQWVIDKRPLGLNAGNLSAPIDPFSNSGIDAGRPVWLGSSGWSLGGNFILNIHSKAIKHISKIVNNGKKLGDLKSSMTSMIGNKGYGMNAVHDYWNGGEFNNTDLGILLEGDNFNSESYLGDLLQENPWVEIVVPPGFGEPGSMAQFNVTFKNTNGKLMFNLEDAKDRIQFFHPDNPNQVLQVYGKSGSKETFINGNNLLWRFSDFLNHNDNFSGLTIMVRVTAGPKESIFSVKAMHAVDPQFTKFLYFMDLNPTSFDPDW